MEILDTGRPQKWLRQTGKVLPYASESNKGQTTCYIVWYCLLLFISILNSKWGAIRVELEATLRAVAVPITPTPPSAAAWPGSCSWALRVGTMHS